MPACVIVMQTVRRLGELFILRFILVVWRFGCFDGLFGGSFDGRIGDTLTDLLALFFTALSMSHMTHTRK